jgi:flagellar protein FlbD
MIELTRLNGHPIVVNAELLKFVEQNPDTVITLITGDKLVVREGAADITRRVLDYRRAIFGSVLASSLTAAKPVHPEPAPAAHE